MSDNALPHVKQNAVVLIVGPRGSGKSVLATHMLKAQSNVTVFDTKHDFSFADDNPRYNLVARTPDEVFKLWRGIEAVGDGAPVIYRPHVGTPGYHLDVDSVARVAMMRQWNVLYYDELADICNVTNYERIAPNYQRVVQQGRSLHVGVWQVTQRPSRIPLIAYSEADFRATFYLRSKADRDRVEEFLGDDLPWTDLARQEHAFVWGDDKTANSDVPLRPHRLILPKLQRSA
jgi:ABC-type dipeptide/oligopeptide/nickel transport system ATPase component